MKKNILLLGGAGYVGTVITADFLRRGYHVTVLDNFVYKNQFAIQPYLGDPNYKLILGDINDPKKLQLASAECVDSVVVLAGLVGDPITKKYTTESKKINEDGIQGCIDFFDDKNISNLLFISTCSNYGLIGENELADEKFELNPLSLYAKAKVAAEKHLLSKKGKVSYTATVLRFATAFGLSPRMRFDLSVSEFVRDLFFGEELLVFDEHTWRPYCHVRDFAQLIDLVLSAPKEKIDFEVFNAGGDVNNNTKKMIVDSILEFLPDAKVKYTEKGSDPRNYKVSFKKVKETLGFEPKYTVPMGIKELINALEMGVYADSLKNKKHYGNYEINY
ncbi:MAG: NAD(P)-dependent oxidoreductase [Phaeodactylibacter sp.]|uniref:NAD-dependent epimerase/dehydratase family protein n=1 Tax=Phaeodactylibacter sp. TaxID=1940289 RepID=UPI0032ED8064